MQRKHCLFLHGQKVHYASFLLIVSEDLPNAGNLHDPRRGSLETRYTTMTSRAVCVVGMTTSLVDEEIHRGAI